MKVGRSSRELKIDFATFQDEKKGPRRGKGTIAKQVEDEEAKKMDHEDDKKKPKRAPESFLK